MTFAHDILTAVGAIEPAPTDGDVSAAVRNLLLLAGFGCGLGLWLWDRRQPPVRHTVTQLRRRQLDNIDEAR